MPGSPVTATIALRPPTAIDGEVAEHVELGVATDERHVGLPAPRQQRRVVPDRLPHPHLLIAAAELDLLVRPEAHARRAQRARGVADEHRPGRRHLLEPGGGVDDVAHRRVVGAGDGAHQHLAGVDADPHPQLVGGMLLAEVAQRGLHRQRRAHGPVGVVLVRDRRPEQRDDRVAEHLVDDAAVGLDVGDEQREGGVDEALDLFGVAALGERREADDVGEQHGHDPPLLVGDRLGNVAAVQWRAAERAEASAVGDRLRARWTPHQKADRSCARSGCARVSESTPSGQPDRRRRSPTG